MNILAEADLYPIFFPVTLIVISTKWVCTSTFSKILSSTFSIIATLSTSLKVFSNFVSNKTESKTFIIFFQNEGIHIASYPFGQPAININNENLSTISLI